MHSCVRNISRRTCTIKLDALIILLFLQREPSKFFSVWFSHYFNTLYLLYQTDGGSFICRFTAEIAFKQKLIPSRHHTHLLNRLNDFDKEWPLQDDEEISNDVEPQEEMSQPEHEEGTIIIDLPMSPLEDLERTLSAHSLSDPLVEVLHIDHMKENVPPQPQMECESHFGRYSFIFIIKFCNPYL